MSLRHRPVVAALILTLSLSGAAATQPPLPPPPLPPPPTTAPQPSVPAIPIMAPQAAPKTEADKKLAEITSPTGGVAPKPAEVVQKLVQFIREHPNYPRLESAYSTLLFHASMLTEDPATTLALADEALAKFPKANSSVRPAAIRAKYAAYRNAKDDAGAAAFAQSLFETETNPALLQVAAQNDKMNGPKLLEKAIAERGKNAEAAAPPGLDVLRWDYALSLSQAGRHDEALTLALQIVDETKKSLADLDALPKEDPKRRQRASLQWSLESRYTGAAAILGAAGQYQRALDFIQLAEHEATDNGLESAERYENQRAGIYGKMAKPELELESNVRLFSLHMEMATRDKIRDLSTKLGKSPDEAYARAREIRTKRATPVKGFELKTLEGKTATLDLLRAKVTLVNFFFPT